MGGTLTLSASLLQAPAKHVEAGVSGALNLELERLSSLAGLDRAHPGLLALQAGANQLSDLHGEAGSCILQNALLGLGHFSSLAG